MKCSCAAEGVDAFAPITRTQREAGLGPNGAVLCSIKEVKEVKLLCGRTQSGERNPDTDAVKKRVEVQQAAVVCSIARQEIQQRDFTGGD